MQPPVGSDERNGESDGAGSLDARIPATGDDRSSNAGTAARVQARSVQPLVEQAGVGVGNRDASLFCVGGSGAGARRGRVARDGWIDSDGPRRTGMRGVLVAHILRCNSDCRDRNGCKSAPASGSRRIGSVFPGVSLAKGPMGSRRERPRRDILRVQRRPSRGAGRGAGVDLAVLTGVAPAFPQANLLSTASPPARLPPDYVVTPPTSPLQNFTSSPTSYCLPKHTARLTGNDESHNRTACTKPPLRHKWIAVTYCF